MAESTRDEPHILDQIYELSHDPANIAEAQNIAGLAAAGTTLAAGLPTATTPGGAGALAIAVGSSYEYGAEHGGTQVILPLEATMLAGAHEIAVGVHEAKEMVSDVFNSITNIFSEPSNSAPPATETPSAPISDGYLMMDTPIPSIFDTPSLTASEMSGSVASSHDMEPENPSSSIPSIFDSTPSVTDSTPAWGTDNSSHSYDAFDSFSSHDSGNNHDGGTGSDN